jgi:TolB-like protein/Tfp pilus assembly protein PilF
MSFFEEIKRRNVIKAASAYVALGWLVVQATATLGPALNLPDFTLSLVTWIGIVAFPFVVMFSWAYELTPEGLKRESEVDRSQSITHVTSRRLDYIIVALLALAIGLFVLQYLRSPAANSPTAAPASAATDAPTPAASSSASAIADAKSIAVLPFADMSRDGDQEYFSDGISEELLNLLAQIPDLRVIARTSSFAFKGKNVPIAEIAQTLNVAHVLEGSVRKSGKQLRITAQLIRAADSTQLWSQTWDRPLDDVFAVQDEIAAAVVAQLKIKLLGAAPTTKAVDPEAYALWLQARQIGRLGNAQAFEQALALFQRAVAIQPGYAAAWSGMATTYTNQAATGLRPVEEAYALAREAVGRALTADPDLASAHANLGWIAMRYDRDLAAAARHYQRALDLAPAEASILGNASTLLSDLNRTEEALAIRTFLVARDPINPQLRANLGSVYAAAGRHAEAIDSYHATLRLAPGYIGMSAAIAAALARQGQLDQALVEASRESNELRRLTVLARIYEDMGRQAEADAALAELLQEFEARASLPHATVYSLRNDVDRAFEWLDKAAADRDSGLSVLARAESDPAWDNVRKDPRWLPFLRQQGWAPEQLAAIEFEVPLPPQ